MSIQTTKKDIRLWLRNGNLSQVLPIGTAAKIAEKLNRDDAVVRRILAGEWFDGEVLEQAISEIEGSHSVVAQLREMLQQIPEPS